MTTFGCNNISTTLRHRLQQGLDQTSVLLIPNWKTRNVGNIAKRKVVMLFDDTKKQSVIDFYGFTGRSRVFFTRYKGVIVVVLQYTFDGGFTAPDFFGSWAQRPASMIKRETTFDLNVRKVCITGRWVVLIHGVDGTTRSNLRRTDVPEKG